MKRIRVVSVGTNKFGIYYAYRNSVGPRSTLAGICLVFIANDLKSYKGSEIAALPKQLIEALLPLLNVRQLYYFEENVDYKHLGIDTEQVWENAYRQHFEQRAYSKFQDCFASEDDVLCYRQIYYDLCATHVLGEGGTCSCSRDRLKIPTDRIEEMASKVSKLSLRPATCVEIMKNNKLLFALTQNLVRVSIQHLTENNLIQVASFIVTLLQYGKLYQVSLVYCQIPIKNFICFLALCSGQKCCGHTSCRFQNLQKSVCNKFEIYLKKTIKRNQNCFNITKPVSLKTAKLSVLSTKERTAGIVHSKMNQNSQHNASGVVKNNGNEASNPATTSVAHMAVDHKPVLDSGREDLFDLALSPINLAKPLNNVKRLGVKKKRQKGKGKQLAVKQSHGFNAKLMNRKKCNEIDGLFPDLSPSRVITEFAVMSLLQCGSEHYSKLIRDLNRVVKQWVGLKHFALNMQSVPGSFADCGTTKRQELLQSLIRLGVKTSLCLQGSLGSNGDWNLQYITSSEHRNPIELLNLEHGTIYCTASLPAFIDSNIVPIKQLCLRQINIRSKDWPHFLHLCSTISPHLVKFHWQHSDLHGECTKLSREDLIDMLQTFSSSTNLVTFKLDSVLCNGQYMGDTGKGLMEIVNNNMNLKSLLIANMPTISTMFCAKLMDMLGNHPNLRDLSFSFCCHFLSDILPHIKQLVSIWSFRKHVMKNLDLSNMKASFEDMITLANILSEGRSLIGGPIVETLDITNTYPQIGVNYLLMNQEKEKVAGPVTVLLFTMATSSSSNLPSSITSCSTVTESDEFSETDIEIQHQVHSHSLLEESETQVFLSVVWQQGKLGVAYYDLDTTQIYMMPDSVETEDFNILRTVKQQIQPACIITSSKQDERLLQMLQDNTAGANIDEKEEGTNTVGDVVQMLPSIDFALDICKRRILSLHLPSMPSHLTDVERSLYMSSLVNFDCVNMVRATGGLLKFLEKKRIGIELEDAEVGIPVLAIVTFSLEDLMIIDENTYRALQIFHKELHPSVYKAGSWNSAKEGLSLFGISNRCKCVIGARLMKLWFLRPIRNIEILNQRQDAIAFFISPRNSEVTTTLQGCLKNIKNIPRILSKMSQAQASVGDWQSLYKTSYNAMYIGDICRAHGQDIDVLKKIGQVFTEDLHRISTLIGNIVDFEESAAQNRFVVKPNVDSELDEKKRTYNGLPDFMTKVAKKEINRLGDEIDQCHICYVPQMGYMLSIAKLDRMKANNDYELPGLDFLFHTNDTVYYKSASTKQLDQLLGDTQCEIIDYETSIMHKLQNTILEHSKILLDVVEYAAQIDCLIALATCAVENNYVRPKLTNNTEIVIKGGRHPLQELCVTPFVPNSTFSGEETSKMKLLTGPNASGKSVYLKQVALIVFMAHIGSFVPAEEATISVVDRIYTRVRTLESVSIGLSTFMIDLNQVSSALQGATEHSVVILDEFGKGTDTCDGLALLCSTLNHWLLKGKKCPHVFVSTHFHSIIRDNLLQGSPQLTFQTMDVLHNNSDLVFLYQLINGHVNTSYACHIASEAGLPKEIVTRGMEVSDLLQHNKPIYRVDIASSDTQLRRYEAIVSQFLELDLEKDNIQGFFKDFVIPASGGLIT